MTQLIQNPILHDFIYAVGRDAPEYIRTSQEWDVLCQRAKNVGFIRPVLLAQHQVLLDWIFDVVLPLLQPLADKHGLGSKWATMCDEQTEEAVQTVLNATYVFDDEQEEEWSDILWNAADAVEGTMFNDHSRVTGLISSVVRHTGRVGWAKMNPVAVLEQLVESAATVRYPTLFDDVNAAVQEAIETTQQEVRNEEFMTELEALEAASWTEDELYESLNSK